LRHLRVCMLESTRTHIPLLKYDVTNGCKSRLSFATAKTGESRLILIHMINEAGMARLSEMRREKDMISVSARQA
jgi:hypothetical protein